MLKKTHYFVLAGGIMGLLITGAHFLESTWLSIGIVAVGVGALQIAKKNTEGLQADERVYQIARKAARKAFLVYIIGGGFIGGLLAILKINSRLTFLGQIWCYSACILLLIYFAFYFYYEWQM